MDMRRLVGENVRRIRQDRGLTQEQFADLSGFSQQYLSGLERGRRNPTVVTLFELATALQAQPVDLLASIEGTDSGQAHSSPKRRRR
jgi:transcriptional regulator with XRE-family HTH domain